MATPAAGRRLEAKIVDTLAICPIAEVARLGRTLKRWRREFLAYFDTDGASNGGTEAMNGPDRAPPPHRPRLPQPHHYRLRMLLIGGRLTSPHLK